MDDQTLDTLLEESQINVLLKHNYNLEFSEAIPISDKAIKLTNNKGSFLLKEIEKKEQQQYKLLVQLYEHVEENRNSYFKINLPKITTSSEPYFHGYNKTFALIPHVNPTINAKPTWGEISTELAKFHLSTKNFIPSNKFFSKYTPWGNLYKEYKEKLEVSQLASRLTTEPNEVDNFWLDKATYFLSIMNDIILYYQNNDGDKIYKDSLKNGTICYSNFHLSNFVNTPKLRFINWNKINLDTRAKDIGDLLIYCYGKTGDKKQISNILTSYNQVHPLTLDEYKLIYAKLLEPKRIIKFISYVYSHEDLDTERISEKIKKVCNFENKKLFLVKDFAKIVKESLNEDLPLVEWIHR